jgi:dipeptide transport system substrate-binding protein
MNKNRLIRAARVISVATAILSATLVTPFAQAASLPNKTLVYCSEGSPAGFDPAQYTTSTDFTANTFTVFNRLVEFERGSTNLEPGLAEKWDISPDGLHYTFHLRHGVTFHSNDVFKPTREFDADDVIFTFQRMMNPNLPFNRAYKAQFPYFVDMGLAKLISTIDKIDPYTVRFTLKEVNAPFLQDMAMEFASIQSAEYADTLLKAGHASDLNSKPIGTGPFIFKRYTKDAVIRFDGNPNYWKKDAVKVGKLIFAITVDPGVRVQKLKRNECQVMSYPRPADLASLRSDPNLQLPSLPGFNLGYLSYNVLHKPLDNVEVRRALDMAINKAAIVESIYQGAGQRATNPMPPTQWSYDKTLNALPYDPAKARDLLAKAGVKAGTEITLWAMPVQRPYNPNARLMAEMIQADWAKVGVKAKIVTYEWGEYIKRAHAGEQDTLLIGWSGDNGDPDNWLGVLLGCDAVNGSNFSKWCSRPFDDMLRQARETTDRTQRTKLYVQLQQIFAQQLPFSPIAHSTIYQPLTKNVLGFKIEPLDYSRFDGVSLK